MYIFMRKYCRDTMAKNEDKSEIVDQELMDLVNSLGEPAASPLQELKSIVPVEAPDKRQVIEKVDDSEEEDAGFEKSVVDYNKIKDGILQAFDDDRNKIQYYIDMIMADATTAGANGIPKMGEKHIEGVSSLMSTKVTVSANKIRLLDAIVRMINVAKPQSKKSILPDLDGLLNSDAPFDNDAP